MTFAEDLISDYQPSSRYLMGQGRLRCRDLSRLEDFGSLDLDFAVGRTDFAT